MYMATPRGDGPWPGVVVIHGVLVMSQDLRNQADWLSDAGDLAAAPDLFHGRARWAGIASVIRDAPAGKGRSYDNIEAVRSELAARQACTGAIGVVGFCMGGGFALMLAPDRGFAASSVNYGTDPKAMYTADFISQACPVVGSFGGKDRVLRGAAGHLEDALGAAGVPRDPDRKAGEIVLSTTGRKCEDPSTSGTPVRS
jgi:carboxymethylenebutenolidase